jgi:hypothetical protein
MDPKQSHLPPSQPSCIINAASAMGRSQKVHYSREEPSLTRSSNPSSCKIDDREPLQSRGLLQEVIRSLNILGESIKLLITHCTRFSDFGHNSTFMPDRFNDVPGTSFALGANEGGAFRYASKGLTEVLASTNEGHLEGVLVDMVLAPDKC